MSNLDKEKEARRVRYVSQSDIAPLSRYTNEPYIFSEAPSTIVILPHLSA